MGKTKKTEQETQQDDAEFVYSTEDCCPMAHPMAGKKLTKRLLKTVRKAAKQKHVKRGVKEVVKALRKGEKGLVIMAGDISPIDVLSHVPVLCEESDVSYCYIPSKQLLGQAACTKRPTSVLMLSALKVKGQDYEEGYTTCVTEVKGLPLLPSVLAN